MALGAFRSGAHHIGLGEFGGPFGGPEAGSESTLEVALECVGGTPCGAAAPTTRRSAKPTKVVNDAAMQALGSYDGGRMLFLGLGTRLARR